MSDAIQIIARGPRETCEAAAARIDVEVEGATYSILEEDGTAWRIDAYPVSDDEADAMEACLDGLAVARVKLADADWIALSLSGLPPVRAGRFFVYGAHDQGLVPPNAVALRIEAGAAFGTGHHGTTSGCLAAFDALLKARRFNRVLDVGTGTGVLAIAAARTGSADVVGTDIDAPSVRIAGENARLNRGRCRMARADGLAHRAVAAKAPYDLVFANILARPLIGLAQDIRDTLTPGGVAILSGLLRSQARSVKAAYLTRGFRLVRRLDIDAWTTLVLERRG
jgi:ribosomal protein L11 methyltransferase